MTEREAKKREGGENTGEQCLQTNTWEAAAGDSLIQGHS